MVNEIERRPDQPDIAAHMPVLEELASRSAVILELGTGFGNGSTRAIAKGLARSTKPDKLWVSVDFDPARPEEPPQGVDCWHLVHGRTEDRLTVGRVCPWMLSTESPLDLLFIDTDHTYKQMQRELELWAGSFATLETIIVAHDTWMFGVYNDMTEAIKKWAFEHPGWEYFDYSLDSHGLGMMRHRDGPWGDVR